MNKKKLALILASISNITFFIALINAIINIVILSNSSPEMFSNFKYYLIGDTYVSVVFGYIFYNSIILDNIDVLNELLKVVFIVFSVLAGVLYYNYVIRIKSENVVSTYSKSYYDSISKTIKTKEDYEYKSEKFITTAIIIFYYSCLFFVIGIPWLLITNKLKGKKLNVRLIWALRILFILFIFRYLIIGALFRTLNFYIKGYF